MINIPDCYRLVGDEDTNVGVQCDHCPSGGMPFAYYEPHADQPTYPIDRVFQVKTINGLLAAIDRHQELAHGACEHKFHVVGTINGDSNVHVRCSRCPASTVAPLLDRI